MDPPVKPGDGAWWVRSWVSLPPLFPLPLREREGPAASAVGG